MIFATSYEAVDFGYMYNDMVRKITSGNSPVHRKVAKRIYTIEGFEELRKSIEDNLYDIWKFEKESPTSKYIFIKPSDVTDDVASIRFAIDSPKTPAELGINSDTRKLGLFFEKITVFGFKE